MFAGGIKENAPLVRTPICEGLGFLGIEPGETQAVTNEDVISAAAAGLRFESVLRMKNRSLCTLRTMVVVMYLRRNMIMKRAAERGIMTPRSDDSGFG